MTRILSLACMCLCAFFTVHAAAAENPEDLYFGDRKLKATDEEEAALRSLNTNRPGKRRTCKAIVDNDGTAHFVYGCGRPLVITAPLQLTDIQLQPGEQVRGLQIGDQSRWSVEAAVTGAAPNEIEHVIIRPADVGIRTSLVITTNRRTYRLQLVADRKKYMAGVVFSHPTDMLAKWARRPAHSAPSVTGRTQPATSTGVASGASGFGRAGENPSTLQNLSFAYDIEGDTPPWKPVRVYNDGAQTVIDMPFSMRQTEAPSLLVIRSEGGLFTDDDVVQMNFRVQDGKYLVDGVPDIIDLMTGVGSTQQRVRIRRTQ